MALGELREEAGLDPLWYTRVAKYDPSKAHRTVDLPVAYLLSSQESNNDVLLTSGFSRRSASHGILSDQDGKFAAGSTWEISKTQISHRRAVTSEYSAF